MRIENEITIKEIIDICCVISNLEKEKDSLEALSYADSYDLRLAAYEESLGNVGEVKKVYDSAEKSQQELSSFLDSYDVYINNLEVKVGKQAFEFIKSMEKRMCYENLVYAEEVIGKYILENTALNISETTEVLRNAFIEQIMKVSDTYFSLVEYKDGTSAEVEAEIKKLELICKEINESHKNISENCELNQSEQDTQKINFMRRRGR